MSEKTNKQAPAKNPSLLDMAKALTKETLSKGRGGSGRTTYLDRFVGFLTDKDGKPLPSGQTRNDIAMYISLDITKEKAADEGIEVDLNDTEQAAEFAKTLIKVKNQVAAAVSDSQNSTALSYNEKYKDKYTVVKEGTLVRLELK